MGEFRRGEFLEELSIRPTRDVKPPLGNSSSVLALD